MKLVYRTPQQFNFIESYEYYFNAVRHSEKNIQNSIRKAMKEFNTHTITLTSIIVGAVTILGVANQLFHISFFQGRIRTFFTIALMVISLVVLVFVGNSFIRK